MTVTNQSEIDHLDNITDTLLNYGFSTTTIQRDYNKPIHEWLRSIDDCLYSRDRHALIIELDFDKPEHVDVAHAIDKRGHISDFRDFDLLWNPVSRRDNKLYLVYLDVHTTQGKKDPLIAPYGYEDIFEDFSIVEHSENETCEMCNEVDTVFTVCKQCDHKWCETCAERIFNADTIGKNCPYCRYSVVEYYHERLSKFYGTW